MRYLSGALDHAIQGLIVLIPFSFAIAPGFTYTVTGLLIFFFLIKKIVNRESLFGYSPVGLPIFFMYIFMLISFKNTIDIRASFQGVGKLTLAVFTILICAGEIKDKRHLKWVVASIIVGAMLASVDAIWQMSFGRDFIRGREPMDFIGIKRATAAFPHTNILGVYLSAFVPLILGLAFFYFKGKKKVGMLLLGAIGVGGLVLTVSRGSAMALFTSILFLGIARKNKIIPVLLLSLLLVFPFVMPAKIRFWAKCVNYNPVRFMLNDDRISIYKNAANMIRQHPFIGVGVNTFSINYLTYKLPEPSYGTSGDSMYAHNNILHMGGETGLLTVGAFFWLLVLLFREHFRAGRLLKDGFLKITLISLSACIAGFLVNGLTEASMYYSRIALLFWFLAGVSLACAKLARTEEKPA